MEKFEIRYGIWRHTITMSRDICEPIIGNSREEVIKEFTEKKRFFWVKLGYDIWFASLWLNGKQVEINLHETVI